LKERTEMNRFRQIIFIISVLSAGWLLLPECIGNCGEQAVSTSLTLPRPDHVVIVIEENKRFSQIIGNPDAPYINSLAKQGALFTRSYAITHPSEPNYLALFSGNTQGVTDDSCPHILKSDNLGSRLCNANLTFGSLSESMPSIGFTDCTYGLYARKHNPCVNWQGINIPASANMPFTAFPKDLSQLPTVSLVIPNMVNDMHNGTIHDGDVWLRNNLDSYIQWAKSHKSLFILTWDEDDDGGDNKIATVFVGSMVKPGVYDQHISHYSILKTILNMYGLAPLGLSKSAKAITGIWIQ
jgi:phosphatidylinositol-3-phosphatase